jgi:transcriptional regulator with XRE-family HTH domain
MKSTPAPDPVIYIKEENPLKTLRNYRNLTQEGLANLSQVSAQFVLKNEQGFYKYPSDAIINALLADIDYDFEDSYQRSLGDYDSILVHYFSWQNSQRKANYGLLDPNFLNPLESYNQCRHLHPFEEWRLHSEVPSRISISKAFCVHPAIITKFENQPHLTATVPNDLIDALQISGYSKDTLNTLQKWFKNHKAYRRALHGTPSYHATGLAKDYYASRD